LAVNAINVMIRCANVNLRNRRKSPGSGLPGLDNDRSDGTVSG
jgi:hypothetical protein